MFSPRVHVHSLVFTFGRCCTGRYSSRNVEPVHRMYTTLSMATTSKKPCNVKVIGTHNGKFHCDEALACYMLRLLPEYHNAHIQRTRDPELLKACDVVVDVGGVYSPEIHRYDHHQRDFCDSMHSLTGGKKSWTTKLSSAGLIFFHFGRRVLSLLADITVEDPVAEELFDCLYTNFVEEVDAVDNGISDRSGTPRYKITSTISHRVGRLNPCWNETDDDADIRFQKAMELVGKEFTEQVLYYKNAWLPAHGIVLKALQERTKVHSSGEVIVLEISCPWTEHLFALEEKLGFVEQVKFVLYGEKGSDKWRIQAVPKHPESFESRLPLLETWRGFRDNELSEVSGIPGCVFVHSSGFIGGNITFDGALSMAVKTIEN